MLRVGRGPGDACAVSAPFLKWAGGKGRLLEQFHPLFPESLDGRGYVEPFLGSGAVFFHIAATRRPARCTLLDANADLINAYVQVRDAVDALLPLLAEHDARHNAPGIGVEARRAYYYGVRAAVPNDPLAAAARFLYLNRTCFNGLHRLNQRGEFNVPMGSYVRPPIHRPEVLRAASARLQCVTLIAAPFSACEAHIAEGDFVYLDPPYEPISATSSFTTYARDGFSRADQAALRDLLLRVSPRCRWMLSNSSAPYIASLYAHPELHHHAVRASRSINAAATRRGHIDELVVTNYPAGVTAGAAASRPAPRPPAPAAGGGARGPSRPPSRS